MLYDHYYRLQQISTELAQPLAHTHVRTHARTHTALLVVNILALVVMYSLGGGTYDKTGESFLPFIIFTRNRIARYDSH